MARTVNPVPAGAAVIVLTASRGSENDADRGQPAERDLRRDDEAAVLLADRRVHRGGDAEQRGGAPQRQRALRGGDRGDGVEHRQRGPQIGLGDERRP